MNDRQNDEDEPVDEELLSLGPDDLELLRARPDEEQYNQDEWWDHAREEHESWKADLLSHEFRDAMHVVDLGRFHLVIQEKDGVTVVDGDRRCYLPTFEIRGLPRDELLRKVATYTIFS